LNIFYFYRKNNSTATVFTNEFG